MSDDKPQRTPGPWRNGEFAVAHVSDSRGRSIANCAGYTNNYDPHVNDENAANAAFIVEACNAHDALVRERDGLREALQDILVDPDDGGPTWKAACRKAKAALAAAEGEPPASDDVALRSKIKRKVRAAIEAAIVAGEREK
jgi:hypothetical protein